MEQIIEILKTVYDPEFPIVDIYTLGLIYHVETNEKGIYILMTLTSPTCPLADVIIDNIKSEINNKFPSTNVEVEITFDPMRTPDMIKDEDLKKMFE